MPAQSQQQQKLFGLALAFKRGEVPASEVSDEIKDIADRMSEKEIEDFAATKHKGLPKMKEQLRKIVREIMRERAISEIELSKSVNEAKNDNKYVVIDFHEKGGGFVMTKPGSKKDAEDSARSIRKGSDISKREVLKVSDARKIRGLAGKNYLNENISRKTIKHITRKGTVHIEIEEDTGGVMVDVIFNRVDLSTTDIQFPTGDVEITKRKKKVKLKESVNEIDTKKANLLRTNMPGYVGPKFAKKASDEDILAMADLKDQHARIYNRYVKVVDDAIAKLQKKYKIKESINEGYSTEEKRIVMMAVRKLSKYRNVPLDYAINDLLGAGTELQRDIKKGKIKK